MIYAAIQSGEFVHVYNDDNQLIISKFGKLIAYSSDCFIMIEEINRLKYTNTYNEEGKKLKSELYNKYK